MPQKLFSRSVVRGVIIAVAFFALFGGFLSPVFAQSSNLQQLGDAAGLSNQDIMTTIGKVIQVLLGMLGVVLLGLTLYAGWLWMTSQGDEEKILKAQAILKNAVIGLILILSAYAITTFLINMFGRATGLIGSGVDREAGIEVLSGSLGAGGIQDHYPARNATGIARNTNIVVTFKKAIDLPSMIAGYDTNDTPNDLTDDVVPSPSYVNADNVEISCVVSGETVTLGSSDVEVSFTNDPSASNFLTTFVFSPVGVLGSASEDSTCKVFLGPQIATAAGAAVFTGSNNDGYQWTFTLSTALDTTPPTIESVIPEDGTSTYARNITVQITFSEAVDPTVTTGTYDEDVGGFTNLQVLADTDDDGTYAPIGGTFVISSGYTVVEFTPSDACGINSCGETVYCLPAPTESATQPIRLKIAAATLSAAPPEAERPYDGVVDMVGNALDGDGDGSAGDDLTVDFAVTDDVVTTGPQIVSVTPASFSPGNEEVTNDQEVVIEWDSLMRSSTLTNSIIQLYAKPDHELWYNTSISTLDADGMSVKKSGETADHSSVTINHGTFLDSVEDDLTTSADETITQLYEPVLPQDIESLYQNCFYPAVGPGISETDTCEGTSNAPYCCNGTPSTGGFNSSTFSCL